VSSIHDNKDIDIPLQWLTVNSPLPSNQELMSLATGVVGGNWQHDKLVLHLKLEQQQCRRRWVRRGVVWRERVSYRVA